MDVLDRDATGQADLVGRGEVGPAHINIGADYCESPVAMLLPVLDMVDPEGAHGIKGWGRALYETGADGIEDARHLGKLPAGLAERGLRQAEIDLICGQSYRRVLDRARPSNKQRPLSRTQSHMLAATKGSLS